MAIERIIPPFPIEEDLTPAMQIDIETDGALATETEDGGMLIDFDPNAFEQSGDFFANLADEMSEDLLKTLSTEPYRAIPRGSGFPQGLGKYLHEGS